MVWASFIIPPTVFLGLGFISSAYFFASSFKNAKTQGDSARRTFLYTKIGLGFLTFGFLLHFVGLCVEAVTFLSWWDSNSDDIERAFQAAGYIRDLGDMLVSFGDASALIALGLLDRGIDIVRTKHSPTQGSKIVAVLASAIAGFIAVLAVVYWIIMVYVSTTLEYYFGGRQHLWRLYDATRYMMLVYFAFLMAAVAVFSMRLCLAVRRSSGSTGTKTVRASYSLFISSCLAAVYFSVAVGFLAFRSGYLLGRWAHIIHALISVNYDTTSSPAFLIVDPIFGTLPILGTFAALFFLGKKKEKGLSSNVAETQVQRKADERSI